MPSATSVIKSIKDLGWTNISLTSKSGLKGAVVNYTTDKGTKTAVGFGSHIAYLIVDEQGAFEAADLESLIKNKSHDMTDPRDIEGLVTLAIVGEGDVEVNEENLAEYGLNDLENVESIKKRLLALDILNSMVDAQP